MKKMLAITSIIALILSATSMHAIAEDTFSHQNGTFRDMSVEQFLNEIGPGYSATTLAYFDPSFGYDPYVSIPVIIDFGLQARSPDDNEYGWNWGQRLVLGKSVGIEFSLKDLPDTPKGVPYNQYSLSCGVQAWQDVTMRIQVENARVELRNQTIELPHVNGTYLTTAYDYARFDKGMAWIFGGLKFETNI